jgi:hypothetical protein
MHQRMNFVLIFAHQTVQYIILVRRNNQLINRQPHLLRHVTRENIAEVTGRNRVSHWANRTT